MWYRTSDISNIVFLYSRLRSISLVLYDSSIRRCLTDPLLCDIAELVDLLCDVTQALIGYAISYSSLIGSRISYDVAQFQQII